ncbi:MAG: D-amino acid dehydrogenase [Burkholderiaceae bacterium]|jgi:D-amino-acid dehydrogenase|nr:MAG: D-amino acid dehydrogenase [Burkholderiaceae bacterium]
MRIAVVGAGVVGVTTAYELAADGHEVTVFERHATPAEEASFANAGLLGASQVLPWAAPGTPGRLLTAMLMRQPMARLRRPLSLRELGWLWQWRRACTPQTFAANRELLQRLGLYSAERLRQLTHDLPISYEFGLGCLLLLRTRRDVDRVEPMLQSLRDAGVTVRAVDARQAREIEPAIAGDTPLAGAIHLPHDPFGNCRQFTMGLATGAELLGAQFRFRTAVTAIDRSAPATLRLADDPVPQRFDAVVLCAGTASGALLRPLGLALPLAPVHGYSISAHVHEPLNAPHGAVVDTRHRVTITRLGRRVRVAGGAEFGGDANSDGAPGGRQPAALQVLYKVLRDWFPTAAQLSDGVQVWRGARPMLPDGLPVLGASGVPGLWLNLGHGAGGWALACGSARLLADLVVGQAPAIDLQGFGVARLRR